MTTIYYDLELHTVRLWTDKHNVLLMLLMSMSRHLFHL